MISVNDAEKLHFTINVSEVTLTNANGILEIMSNAVDMESKNIIIDFKDVTAIDSSGISMLVKFVQRFGTGGRKVTLMNVSSDVKKIMEMVNLSHFFRIL